MCNSDFGGERPQRALNQTLILLLAAGEVPFAIFDRCGILTCVSMQMYPAHGRVPGCRLMELSAAQLTQIGVDWDVTVAAAGTHLPSLKKSVHVVQPLSGS